MKSLFAGFCLVLLTTLFASSAMGQSARLVGQIVCCAECWAEADRTKVEFGTAEDLLKSQSCIAKGEPTLLAVREGNRFTLYRLELAKFRLPGKNWLEFIGKSVAVTGTVEKKKTSVIRVDNLEVIEESIAERDAANAVGKEIDFSLKDLFDNEQRLSSLKGRIVVLNFWATYCLPCRKEMPDLGAIQNEYAALGVQVVGASTDEAQDRDKVLQFVKETKINFPIWIGATTVDMMRFGLGGALPGTVVIGRDGRIAKAISGVVNQTDLRKQIELMLASPGKAVANKRKQEREQIAKSRPGDVSSVPS